MPRAKANREQRRAIVGVQFPALRGYRASIKQAVPEADITDLAEIEEIMRNDILHSTLDWVTPTQFDETARLAYEVLLASRTRYAGSKPARLNQ